MHFIFAWQNSDVNLLDLLLLLPVDGDCVCATMHNPNFIPLCS